MGGEKSAGRLTDVRCHRLRQCRGIGQRPGVRDGSTDEPHESLHLWHAGGLVALGVITVWVQSFDLRCIKVGVGAQ